MELSDRAQAIKVSLNAQGVGMGDIYEAIELNPTPRQQQKRKVSSKVFFNPKVAEIAAKRQEKLSAVNRFMSSLDDRTDASRPLEIAIRNELRDRPGQWVRTVDLAEDIARARGQFVDGYPYMPVRRGSSFGMAKNWLAALGIVNIKRLGNKEALRYVEPEDRIFRRGSLVVYLPCSRSERLAIVTEVTMGEHGVCLRIKDLSDGVEKLTSPETTSRVAQWAELQIVDRMGLSANLEKLRAEMEPKKDKAQVRQTAEDALRTAILTSIRSNPSVTLCGLLYGLSPNATVVRGQVDWLLGWRRIGGKLQLDERKQRIKYAPGFPKRFVLL